MELDNFVLKMKQEFISESIQMLSRAEQHFAHFKEDFIDCEIVDEIFRFAQTIKSSSITCGFAQLGEFAHAMETLLLKIREGRHHPDSDTVDVLLRAHTTLRQYFELLKADFDAVLDVEAMKTDLQNLTVAVSQHYRSQSAIRLLDDEKDESSLAKAVEFMSSFRHGGNKDTVLVKGPLDELTYLTLKAYLGLSGDRTAAGIETCLKTLEKALAQLSLLRS